MSSHILSEVQQLATRIGVINEGCLVEEVDYDELQRRNRTYLEIQVSDTAKAVWVLEEKLKLRDFSVHEENRVRVYEALDQAAQINLALANNGILVSRLDANEENLEDHFIRLVGMETDHEGGDNGNGTGAANRFDYQPDIYRVGSRNANKVAITFDDGPSRESTPVILDILREHEVPDTFLLVGIHVEKYPDIAQRIVEEGHEIGNHTYWHHSVDPMGPAGSMDPHPPERAGVRPRLSSIFSNS